MTVFPVLKPARVVERRVRNAEVDGSIPFRSTTKILPRNETGFFYTISINT